ncbi:MAG: PRTRC system ThiF family protein [Humidesulfovibrio sp.]
MRFTIDKAAFAARLVTAARVSSRGQSVYRSLILSAIEGELMISATDGSVEFYGTAPATVEQTGEASVCGKFLHSLVKCLPAGPLSLETDGMGNLVLRSGQLEYTLATDPAWDTESLSTEPAEGGQEVAGALLCEAIDRVSASNVGRQSFSPGDVGQYKAAVLVTRVNRFFGLDWEDLPVALGSKKPEQLDWLRHGLLEVVISCVDSGRARRKIGQALKGWLKDPSYWLDFGNSRSTGQVILGTTRLVDQGDQGWPDRGWADGLGLLPTVLDLYPDIEASDDDAEPSCGMAEALARQDLYMNATLADFGLSLLWRLVHQGSIEHHGLFLNLEQCLATPLRIDPEAWKRMGWEATA